MKNVLRLAALVGSVVFLGAVCTQNGNTNTGVVNMGNENSNTSVDSSVDTANWLTYTNEEYGFKMEYPDNWTVEIVDENHEGGMGLGYGDVLFKSENCLVKLAKSKSNLDQYYASLNPEESQRAEYLQINQTKALRFFGVTNENDLKGFIYLFPLDDQSIIFIPTDNPSAEECKNSLEKMMLSVLFSS